MATQSEALLRLQNALDEANKDLTRSDRIIAAYLKDNLSQLAFDSGAVISSRIGVSEMSFIRFIRKLGYKSLKEIKDELRSGDSGFDRHIDNVKERFRVRSEDAGEFSKSLELQLDAVVAAYRLMGLERWKRVVDLLSTRQQILVVGFQASKGAALDFATRLEYARDSVRFIESTSGVFSEVLEVSADKGCLVLIDTIAYAKKGMLLAQRAKDQDMPLVIITDHFSNWAYDHTELVLQGYTQVNTFWDSAASLSIITNLLVNAVATKLGESAATRFAMMKELGDHFGEFETSTARPLDR